MSADVSGLHPRPDTNIDTTRLRQNLETLQAKGNELADIARRAPTLARGRIPSHTSVQGLAPVLVPAARTLNLRDVLELLRWHNLRIKLLRAELDREGLHEVVAPGAVAKVSTTGSGTALTGYCCSGSWMVGVERRTHNPLLSWKLMEEMTSFDVSVRRSKEGAGVPVRKDFYDVCGHETVRRAEHLTWNELLLFCGARARRRDRTLCSHIKAAPVFDTIFRQVLQCMTLAKSWSEIPAPERRAQHEEIKRSAAGAVGEIFTSVRHEMEHGAEEPCASCPMGEGCRPLMHRNPR